jgi:GntP family gluconate:H+ symporter
VVLISTNTVAKALSKGDQPGTFVQRAGEVTAILGNPNLALLVSAAIAMALVVWKRQLPLRELAQTVDKALMSGGIIILITAAGGAFGAMLREAGIQDYIEESVAPDERNLGLMILLVAFGVSSLVKFAQGSGTVAMITAASMFAAMGLSAETLGFSPVYLAMAIGSGSLVGDWMNNSGFWIFARMSVLTEAETLKTWTILTALLGLTGLGFTVLLARLLPLV